MKKSILTALVLISSLSFAGNVIYDNNNDKIKNNKFNDEVIVDPKSPYKPQTLKAPDIYIQDIESPESIAFYRTVGLSGPQLDFNLNTSYNSIDTPEDHTSKVLRLATYEKNAYSKDLKTIMSYTLYNNVYISTPGSDKFAKNLEGFLIKPTVSEFGAFDLSGYSFEGNVEPITGRIRGDYQDRISQLNINLYNPYDKFITLFSLGNTNANKSIPKEMDYYIFSTPKVQEVSRVNGLYVGQAESDDELPRFRFPYYARSFTAFCKPIMWNGTSFAAPTLSRIMSYLRIIYPYLQYNQLKQIVLTTANTNVINNGVDGSYLSSTFGWGIVNPKITAFGPTQFNAGLIDEQKYFAGMYDRIYDNNYNTYFYVDIPSYGSMIFKNDISTGLTGNSNDDTYETAKLKIGENKDDYANFRFYKVLPSEKRFYKDTATAGLRKDGKGRLTLLGNQNYYRTQVLDGILDVVGKPCQMYEVFDDAYLSVELKSNIKILKTDKGKITINVIKNTNNKIKYLCIGDVNDIQVSGQGKFTIENIVVKDEDTYNKIYSKLKTYLYTKPKMLISQNKQFVEDVHINNNKRAFIPVIDRKDLKNGFLVHNDRKGRTFKDINNPQVNKYIPTYRVETKSFISLKGFKLSTANTPVSSYEAGKIDDVTRNYMYEIGGSGTRYTNEELEKAIKTVPKSVIDDAIKFRNEIKDEIEK